MTIWIICVRWCEWSSYMISSMTPTQETSRCLGWLWSGWDSNSISLCKTPGMPGRMWPMGSMTNEVGRIASYFRGSLSSLPTLDSQSTIFGCLNHHFLLVKIPIFCCSGSPNFSRISMMVAACFPMTCGKRRSMCTVHLLMHIIHNIYAIRRPRQTQGGARQGIRLFWRGFGTSSTFRATVFSPGADFFEAVLLLAAAGNRISGKMLFF